MLNANSKKPIGMFTVSLFALAMVIQLWPESNCNKLKNTLASGFFMTWQSPNLIIIQPNKEQLSFASDSHEGACEIANLHFNRIK